MSVWQGWQAVQAVQFLLPLGSQGLMRLILVNSRPHRSEPAENENHSHALPKQGTVTDCERFALCPGHGSAMLYC